MMAWPIKDVLGKRNSDAELSSGGKNERNGAEAVQLLQLVQEVVRTGTIEREDN